MMTVITYIPVEGQCKRCGQAFRKLSANAKYCEACRPIKARESMAKAQAKRKRK